MLMDGLFLFMIMAVMDGHLMLFMLAAVIMRAVAVIELRETLHPATIADITAMQAHHLSAQQGKQEEEPMEEMKHGGEYFDSSGDCRALFCVSCSANRDAFGAHLAEPFNKLRNALMNVRGGLEVQQRGGLAHIGGG